MESDKLGVCVIGAGRAGLIHAVNFAKGIKNARLTAISEPNRETAEKACRELELERQYQDYRQALDDDQVDAVVVSLRQTITGTSWLPQPKPANTFCAKSPWR